MSREHFDRFYYNCAFLLTITIGVIRCNEFNYVCGPKLQQRVLTFFFFPIFFLFSISYMVLEKCGFSYFLLFFFLSFCFTCTYMCMQCWWSADCCSSMHNAVTITYNYFCFTRFSGQSVSINTCVCFAYQCVAKCFKL